MLYRLAFVLILVLTLSGCASTYYRTPEIDIQTGMYVTDTAVGPDAVRKRDVNVDLRKFRFVYLETDTIFWPARFEFFARAALAHVGFRYVLNTQELSRFITSNPQLSSIRSTSDLVSQHRLTELVGPILYVKFSVQTDGGARRYVDLTVTDLSNGDTLLAVSHFTVVWTNFDKEAHYPVLNELKKWVDECGRGTGI